MFTAEEKAQIANIAMQAEVEGYQGDLWITQIRNIVGNGRDRVHAFLDYLLEHKQWRPLFSLYLEMSLRASDLVDSRHFHVLERV